MKIIASLILFFSISLSSYCQIQWSIVSNEIDGKKKNGIIDESGNILVPVLYDRIYKDGDFYFIKNDKYWGCCKKGGKILIPLVYDDIGLKVGEELIRVKKNGLWGFVDLNNTLVIDYKFDFACNFDNGKAYTALGNTFAFIDKKGKIVSKLSSNQKYCPENLSTDVELKNQFKDSILIVFKENDKFGVKEKSNDKIIVPANFDEIGNYFFGVILVKKNNKWGAYYETGKLITEPIYNSIGIFWKE